MTVPECRTMLACAVLALHLASVNTRPLASQCRATRQSIDRPAPPRIAQDQSRVVDIDITHMGALSQIQLSAVSGSGGIPSHVIDGPSNGALEEPTRNAKVRNNNPRSWPQASVWQGKQESSEAAPIKHRTRNSTKPLPQRRYAKDSRSA